MAFWWAPGIKGIKELKPYYNVIVFIKKIVIKWKKNLYKTKKKLVKFIALFFYIMIIIILFPDISSNYMLGDFEFYSSTCKCLI